MEVALTTKLMRFRGLEPNFIESSKPASPNVCDTVYCVLWFNCEQIEFAYPTHCGVLKTLYDVIKYRYFFIRIAFRRAYGEAVRN